MTPALLTPYGTAWVVGCMPAPDDTLTIDPPRPTMWGMAYLVHRNTPRMLVSRVRFQTNSETSASGGVRMRIPALFTNTSSFPKRSSVWSTMLLTCSALETSVSTNRASPPASPTMATVFRPSGTLRSATVTLAPSPAKRSAAARPMPVAPPVIMATLSSRRPGIAPPRPGVV